MFRNPEGRGSIPRLGSHRSSSALSTLNYWVVLPRWCCSVLASMPMALHVHSPLPTFGDDKCVALRTDSTEQNKQHHPRLRSSLQFRYKNNQSLLFIVSNLQIVRKTGNSGRFQTIWSHIPWLWFINSSLWPTVFDLSGGGGLTPLVPLNPQVCIDPLKIVKISYKYMYDPPFWFSNKSTRFNRVLMTNEREREREEREREREIICPVQQPREMTSNNVICSASVTRLRGHSIIKCVVHLHMKIWNCKNYIGLGIYFIYSSSEQIAWHPLRKSSSSSSYHRRRRRHHHAHVQYYSTYSRVMEICFPTSWSTGYIIIIITIMLSYRNLRAQ